MLTISLDINLYITVLLICAVSILLLFLLFDIYYFIRFFYIIIIGLFIKERRKVTDKLEIYGFCNTTDLDIYLNHMNNARFVRELDFARMDFFKKTGLYDVILQANGYALQTATNIRYRRPISLFTLYKITTKIIYLEEKTIYLEHEFIGINDGFIYAVAMGKQSLVGTNVEKTLQKLGINEMKMDKTEELDDWINLMMKSSKKLKRLIEE